MATPPVPTITPSDIPDGSVEAKMDFLISTILENIESYFANMKKTRLLLRQSNGKLNKKLDLPINNNIDNEQVSNKMKFAESLNNYFANDGKTTSKIFQKGNTSYTNYLAKPVINSMFMGEIDCLHVMDIVKTLKPKISNEFDKTSSKLIKGMISNIIHPVTHIINRSLNTAIVLIN